MSATEALLFLISLITLALLCQTTTPLAPKFSAEGFVNAASNSVGPLAPNTLASLYGSNLSFNTRALAAEDIRARALPTVLTGTGVRVMIGNQFASMYYVSPTQVNLLVPSNILPGTYNLELVRDGLLSPPVTVVIAPEAPQFFVQILLDKRTFVSATHVDGTPVDLDRPARPGDIVSLYATGLGSTRPDTPYGQIATAAASIRKKKEFKIYLNEVEVAEERVMYAGVAPGFGGLYQVNLKLPNDTPENPQLRMGFGAPSSVEGVQLAVKLPDSSEAAVDPASSLSKPDPGSR